MKYQVTVVDSKGKYKPFSTIVDMEGIDLNNSEDKRRVKTAGLTKICQKRKMRSGELLKYFDGVCIREYDKEKIEAENAWKYAIIKHQKYKTGEWKAPKNEG